MLNNQRSLWWEKMLIKYGSEEAVREEMRQRQIKSREKYKGTGGFRALPKEKVIEISKLGVQARRHNVPGNTEHTDNS